LHVSTGSHAARRPRGRSPSTSARPSRRDSRDWRWRCARAGPLVMLDRGRLGFGARPVCRRDRRSIPAGPRALATAAPMRLPPVMSAAPAHVSCPIPCGREPVLRPWLPPRNPPSRQRQAPLSGHRQAEHGADQASAGTRARAVGRGTGRTVGRRSLSRRDDDLLATSSARATAAGQPADNRAARHRQAPRRPATIAQGIRGSQSRGWRGGSAVPAMTGASPVDRVSGARAPERPPRRTSQRGGPYVSISARILPLKAPRRTA
jgi:hypothetical protein